MRTFILFAIFASSISASATADFSPLTFLDFTGWDHQLVQSPAGQLFTDIFGTVDVRVHGVGPFTEPSAVMPDAKTIVSRHTTAHPNSNDSLLEFSDGASVQLRTVVEFVTVDAQEEFTVTGQGPESYMHLNGAVPTITTISNGDVFGSKFVGNGLGVSPTGASHGQVLNDAGTMALRVTHTALANNKNEFFKIGVLVPEPTTAGLLASFIIGLAGFRRKSG